MDTTPRGYPYPECDPPLTKDLSDIGQVRALAEAIDADMTAVAADANRTLLQPDAIRLTSATVNVPAGGDVEPNFNTVTFTNNPAMDGPLGVIAPVSGWYLVGTFAVITAAANAQTLIMFRVNGEFLPFVSDQPGVYAGGNALAPYLSDTVHLNQGDHINVRITRGAGQYSYTARMWALKLRED